MALGKKIAIIGAGNMGEALIAGMLAVAFPVWVSVPAQAAEVQTQMTDTQKEQAGRHSEELFRLFEYERSICVRFTNLVAEDSEWIQRFLSLEVRQREGIPRLLLESKHRETEPFVYILQHREIFDIDVDFHGRHLAKAGPIYCDVGLTRLRQLEVVGPSSFSWNARKTVLDECFEDLNWPWTEAAYGHEFEFCLALLNEAKRLYKGTEFERDLQKFVERQVKSMTMTEDELRATEGYAGKTAQQHAQELTRWIKELLH